MRPLHRSLPLAVVLVLATALVAQKPKEAPTQVPMGGFAKSIDVTVTNLDVVVTDSKGKRVTGLKKEDFDVIEDGLQQLVTNFFAVDGGKLTFVGDEPVPTPVPAVGSAPTPVPAAAPIPLPKTRIVIFVDNLHLTPFNRNRVLKNVQDWVRKSVGGDVEAMVVTWDRSLKVRRKFTNDARDVADVLKQIEDISAMGLTQVSERKDLIQTIDDAQTMSQAEARVRQYALAMANDLQFTFDAMKTTINQLAGVEGRKIMLHVSEGLPQSPGAEMFQYMQDKFNQGGATLASFEFDKTSSYIGIVQAANAAGVTLYTFDASGLAVDSTMSAENRTNAGRMNTFLERNNLQSMLTLIAEETGGQAVLNRNDITLPLNEVSQDFSSYYSLGYRSLRSGSDRPHKVDVKVKRKGLTARARRSYVEKSPETRVIESVTSALYFPRDDNPLAVGIQVGQPVPADRQNYLVPFKIRVPYSRITTYPEGQRVRGRLLFYFIVVDASGKESDLATQTAPVELTAKQFEAAQRGDFIYDVKMLMIPGSQKLSLAVRDEITNTVSYVQKSIFVSALPPSEEPAKK